MKKILTAAAIVAAASLGGCAGVPVGAVILTGQAALGAAMSEYCSSTTEEAKQAVRNKLTGGVPVIPCEGP